MSEHVLTMTGGSQSQVQSPTAQRNGRHSSSARWKRPESWEYRVLYGVTFAVFLIAACVELLDPRRYIARKEHAGINQTVIQRASLGARTCVAYAFMG